MKLAACHVGLGRQVLIAGEGKWGGARPEEVGALVGYVREVR